MRFALIVLACLTWALWLGGTIATMVIGKHLFNALPHDIAGQAANEMFHVFARYEGVLTAISILLSGFLLVTYPSKSFLLLMAMFILAAGMVITVTLGFMPAMDSLIEQGKQHSHEFLRLHIKSMIAMTIQAVLLLLTAPVILKSVPAGEITVEKDSVVEVEEKSEFEKSKGVPRGL